MAFDGELMRYPFPSNPEDQPMHDDRSWAVKHARVIERLTWIVLALVVAAVWTGAVREFWRAGTGGGL